MKSSVVLFVMWLSLSHHGNCVGVGNTVNSGSFSGDRISEAINRKVTVDMGAAKGGRLILFIPTRVISSFDLICNSYAVRFAFPLIETTNGTVDTQRRAFGTRGESMHHRVHSRNTHILHVLLHQKLINLTRKKTEMHIHIHV